MLGLAAALLTTPLAYGKGKVEEKDVGAMVKKLAKLETKVAKKRG